MNDQDEPIEYELLRQAALAEIVVDDTQINPTTADDRHVRIEGRLGLEEDEDGEPDSDVEHYAFGFIYALGVLSFADARPRGNSGMDFEEKDDWAVSDMLRRLRFEGGELRFYADYVRGRCLKTTVIVRADGTFMLDTVNRGETATRWIAKLQGQKLLRAIPADGAKP
ncbi:MAG: hypothetical protein IPF92_20605 [Myxococcales bacterium]|nr:hypothetical protein [Myxococcales bacterium]